MQGFHYLLWNSKCVLWWRGLGPTLLWLFVFWRAIVHILWSLLCDKPEAPRIFSIPIFCHWNLDQHGKCQWTKWVHLNNITQFFFSPDKWQHTSFLGFQLRFKGRNAVNREGLFYGISTQKEDMAITIEKSNVIVPKGTYEHIGLSFQEVRRCRLKRS